MNKTAIIIFSMLCSNSFAQTYKCHATNAHGVTVKFDQVILITDSIVKITSGQPTINYKRLPSTGNIYFTDGVVEYSLAALDKTGNKKGLPYTVELVISKNIKSPEPLTYINYCRKD